MNDSYNPKPIDTSHVPQSPQREALIETLAENAHDVWARKRMTEGWIHGVEKDDARRTTPLLVSYRELPDAEKDTDRVMVRGAIEGAMAYGWSVEPPPRLRTLSPAQAETLADWDSHLEGRFTAAMAGEGAWLFDMDDSADLATGKLDAFPIAKEAITHLQNVVYPAWLKADKEACRDQKRHRWAATFAIWPGIIAIVCATLQLAFPGEKATLGHCETIAVAVAFVSVIVGLLMHLHHGWLSSRQKAERLRILKFSSLSDPQLWCDLALWKKKVTSDVEKLNEMNTHLAKDWAMKLDSVASDLPAPPECEVPTADIQAITILYRVKRLKFQRHYFAFQSGRAARRSLLSDKRIALGLFFLCVAIVLMHVFHVGGYYWEAPLIAMAALLPVLGFGIRAWVLAFEAPRSRNLYSAKALALDAYIERSHEKLSDTQTMLQHIARGEQFFENEHREWCRLQMEAEWFV